MEAVEAWASTVGSPVYDCLTYQYCPGRPDNAKVITRPNGAIRKSAGWLATRVEVTPGARFVSVGKTHGSPIIVTDIVMQPTGLVWCRSPSDAVSLPPWRAVMRCKVLPSGAKVPQHFGQRYYDVEHAVRDYRDITTNWEEWEVLAREPRVVAHSTPPSVSLGLEEPPAVAAEVVAAVTRGAVNPHSVEFAALGWLVASGEVAAARAVNKQVLHPDTYVVVWREGATAGGAGDDDKVFAVARGDGSAFVRVEASYSGDLLHGGVVAKWYACLDGSMGPRDILTIYSNRKREERQAVVTAGVSEVLLDATYAALEWASSHHPAGENFAAYNTEEDARPGSSESDLDSDLDSSD
jgi:hypothetical protein